MTIDSQFISVASLRLVTDFLVSLFESGFQVVIIKPYRSVLLSFIRGFSDGSTISSSEVISSLLKGMFS